MPSRSPRGEAPASGPARPRSARSAGAKADLVQARGREPAPARAGPPPPDPRGRRVEQAADLGEQRRRLFGTAALVAVPAGEPEALARQGQAGVEEVALLGLGLSPGGQAELGAAARRRGRDCRRRGGELAVLERGDEEVAESARRAAGRGWRSAPGPRPGRARGASRGLGSSRSARCGPGSRPPRAPRSPERLDDLGAGPQLLGLRGVGNAAAGLVGRQRPLGDVAGDLADDREQAPGVLGSVQQPSQLGQLAPRLLLPDGGRLLGAANPPAQDFPLEPSTAGGQPRRGPRR